MARSFKKDLLTDVNKVKLDLLTDVDMLNKKFKTSIKSRISIEKNAIKFNQEAWLKPFI